MSQSRTLRSPASGSSFRLHPSYNRYHRCLLLRTSPPLLSCVVPFGSKVSQPSILGGGIRRALGLAVSVRPAARIQPDGCKDAGSRRPGLSSLIPIDLPTSTSPTLVWVWAIVSLVMASALGFAAGSAYANRSADRGFRKALKAISSL